MNLPGMPGVHAGDLAAALLDAGPEAKAQQSRWSHQMKEDNSAPIIAHAKALFVERPYPHPQCPSCQTTAPV